MSQDASTPRPQQVTAGGWVTVVSAAMLVFSTFDEMSSLRSVEKREQITEALDSAGGRSIGVSVDQVLSAMHVGLLVLGAAAAAAVVLGVFALRRHRQARIVLTVLAVVIVLSGLLADTLLGLFVGVGVTMLWSGPARDWFAGRPVRETPNPFGPVKDKPGRKPDQQPNTQASQQTSAPPEWQPPVPPAGAVQPPPHPNFGTPPITGQPGQPENLGPDGQSPQGYPQQGYPAQPLSAAQPPGYPYASAPAQPAAYPQQVSAKAPSFVRAAVIITLIAAGSLVVIYVLSLIALLVARDELVAELMTREPIREAGVSADDLVTASFVGVGIGLFWALSACVLAILVGRRRNWARLTLVVSATLAAVIGLAGLPLTVLHIGACVAVIVMLAGSRAKDWFTGSSAGNPPGNPPNLPPGPPANTAPPTDAATPTDSGYPKVW